MKLESKLSLRRRLVFLVMVLLTAYFLVSVAVAINTADTCGGNDHAPKHWAAVPPHWVCD